MIKINPIKFSSILSLLLPEEQLKYPINFSFMRRILLVTFLSALEVAYSQMNWVSLPQTTNGEIIHLNIYNNKLIAAGRFKTAGNVIANNIAAWDGNTWSSLGKGLYGDFVYRTMVYNNELYAIGSFDSAGTVAADDVAKWNGTNWVSLSNGNSAGGRVHGIAAYNGDIYISGSFSVTNGVPTKNVAKLTSTGWQQPGQGLNINPQGIYNLIVYNNKLYATGDIANATYTSTHWIKVLNGNTWDTVGTNSFYGLSAGAIVWKNKLLIASQSGSTIPQWNDTTWSNLSSFNSFTPKRFGVISNTLYCVGENYASTNCIAFWDESNNTWNSKGAGVNGNVRGIIEYNGEIYCSGDFDSGIGSSINYIAKWGLTTNLNEESYHEEAITIAPNPIIDKLRINTTKLHQISLTILNSLGQTVLIKNDFDTSKELDLAYLPKGIYYLKIENLNGQKVFKIIKE